MQVKMTAEQLEAFHKFVAEIPTMLEELQTLLQHSKKYINNKANFEDESMLAVGSFYIDVLEGKEKIVIPESRLDRLFIAYYGQAIIYHFDGYWELNDIKEDSSFNTPVIVGWGKEKENIRISPTEARNSIRKNKNKEDAIHHDIHYTKDMIKKIDDFFNDWK